jgi:hypothetical protein
VEPKPPREVLLDALPELRDGLEELELPNHDRELELLVFVGASRTASIAVKLGRGRPSGRLAPK